MDVARVLPVLTDLPQNPQKGRFVVLVEVHPGTDKDHKSYNKMCQELQNTNKAMVIDMKDQGMVMYLLPPDCDQLDSRLLKENFGVIRPVGVMVGVGVIKDTSLKYAMVEQPQQQLQQPDHEQQQQLYQQPTSSTSPMYHRSSPSPSAGNRYCVDFTRFDSNELIFPQHEAFPAS